jgi:hypothetical protein
MVYRCQALLPGELLSFESKFEGDFFFDKMSLRSGDERSCLKGTNIGFINPLRGLEGDPRRGCGDWIGGEDGDEDVNSVDESGLVLALRGNEIRCG